MTSTQASLTDRPGSKYQIAKAVFWPDIKDDRVAALQRYYEYYNEELKLLQKGISTASWQTNCLAVKTYEDVFLVIDVLRRHGKSRRPDIREDLSSRIPSLNCHGINCSINCSINLALRLSLMINVQEPEFAGLRSEVAAVQWNDEQMLSDFLQSLFPKAQWQTTAQSSRLGPHFTAAFMNRVCGLRIKWTTSLHDHLQLDLQRKALKIFPYKCHLQALIDSHQNRVNGNDLLISLDILKETILSLNLLFPFWDGDTAELLAREDQNFNDFGPFEVTRSPNLMDFDYWRDRLLELREEIYQSPPASWTQLWRDRRNPQQFWTFWIALMILALTLLSTTATLIQAWAGLKALKMANKSTG